MDTTCSASEAARLLETSVPRIQRAIRCLGLPVAHGPAGRAYLNPAQVERLREHLGVTPPVRGLSRIEARVLAALARAPLGVASVRALARRAGVSSTAAGRAVRSLEGKGLAGRRREWVAAGRAREIELIDAKRTSPRWHELAPQLARVELPRASVSRRQRRVPPRLRHLFWNTAPSQLDVGESGGYIARRLITVGDPEGLAWGVANLSAGDWRHAARGRGLSREARATALNLARAARGPA